MVTVEASLASRERTAASGISGAVCRTFLLSLSVETSVDLHCSESRLEMRATRLEEVLRRKLGRGRDAQDLKPCCLCRCQLCPLNLVLGGA